jgi:hypothetical protein
MTLRWGGLHACASIEHCEPTKASLTAQLDVSPIALQLLQMPGTSSSAHESPRSRPRCGGGSRSSKVKKPCGPDARVRTVLRRTELVHVSASHIEEASATTAHMTMGMLTQLVEQQWAVTLSGNLPRQHSRAEEPQVRLSMSQRQKGRRRVRFAAEGMHAEAMAAVDDSALKVSVEPVVCVVAGSHIAEVVELVAHAMKLAFPADEAETCVKSNGYYSKDVPKAGSRATADEAMATLDPSSHKESPVLEIRLEVPSAAVAVLLGTEPAVGRGAEGEVVVLMRSTMHAALLLSTSAACVTANVAEAVVGCCAAACRCIVGAADIKFLRPLNIARIAGAVAEAKLCTSLHATLCVQAASLLVAPETLAALRRAQALMPARRGNGQRHTPHAAQLAAAVVTLHSIVRFGYRVAASLGEISATAVVKECMLEVAEGVHVGSSLVMVPVATIKAICPLSSSTVSLRIHSGGSARASLAATISADVFNPSCQAHDIIVAPWTVSVSVSEEGQVLRNGKVTRGPQMLLHDSRTPSSNNTPSRPSGTLIAFVTATADSPLEFTLAETAVAAATSMSRILRDQLVMSVPAVEESHSCSAGNVLNCPLIVCNRSGLNLFAVIAPLPSWNTSAAADAFLEMQSECRDATNLGMPQSPQSAASARAAGCTRLTADMHDTIMPLRALCHSCMLSDPLTGRSLREWSLEDFSRCGLYVVPADGTAESAAMLGPLPILPRLSEASAGAAVGLCTTAGHSRIRVTATMSVSPVSRCLQLMVHAGVCIENHTAVTVHVCGCAPRAASIGHLQAAGGDESGRRLGEGRVTVLPGEARMVPAQTLAMGGFQVMLGCGEPDR